MYCSVSCRRGRMNDQAWKIRGGREGSIERVRQWRCCACRPPPSSERIPPGEGRIVTRGVRHAQHRLLNFRGYDARNNGAARSGFPSSLGCDPRKGRLVTESRLRVAGAPRLPAAVGSAASEVMMLGSGEFLMLLRRCCLLLMLWLLMLLLLLRPRGRTVARPMRASSPRLGENSIVSSRRNVLLGCTECAVRALSEKVRGGCVHSL